MALGHLPISPRKIEDALQIGHGTLPQLLDGRIDDWLPPDQRKAAPPPALSAEILEAIRTTVREEISRAGLTPGAERKKTGRRR